MELNREQIVKALECCIIGDCEPCAYRSIINCRDHLCGDVLSLINELAEENEGLRAENTKWQARLRSECEYTEKITVRKYREQLHRAFAHSDSKDKFNKGVFLEMVDLIAEEMIGGNNVNKEN